ncbi:hypothetical protein [Listeria phage P100plus]|uniref:Uncharacterized protein n=2 Tax=Pecentumvirus P100 TaxID=330395 RepID=A0A6H2A840_9CAUD|nr:hypothetical protein [Listeria phage P100plus]QJB22561.1 hypothetical protein [Listeria phage P200]
MEKFKSLGEATGEELAFVLESNSQIFDGVLDIAEKNLGKEDFDKHVRHNGHYDVALCYLEIYAEDNPNILFEKNTFQLKN